mmetsp:Transcript_6043/g.14283  ORF Transcript_6043/g.14283 Transcript_6043/m.14283 type:complete len:174 (+) Transcript_6043:79-600(+)
MSASSSSSSITKYGKVLPILGLLYFVGAIALDYLHKESLTLPQGASDLNGLKKEDGSSSSLPSLSSSSSTLLRQEKASRPLEHDSLFDYEGTKIATLENSLEAITARLQPRRLQLEDNDDESKAISHQILHLHNMKTAGTSIDKRLNCAIKRMSADYNVTIPRYSTFVWNNLV